MVQRMRTFTVTAEVSNLGRFIFFTANLNILVEVCFLHFFSPFFFFKGEVTVQTGDLLPCRICGRTFFPAALVSSTSTVGFQV